ncbi:hypothetical protein Q5752_000566 [Cryptotrichosporon argae]
MNLSPAVASTSAQPQDAGPTVDVRLSKGGRLTGKAWKGDKTAARRTFIAPALKTPFKKRMDKEQARKAVLAVEREMKDEKEAEAERRRTAIRERRERQAEKKRLEDVAAKMSVKKAQRMKKRLGRSKKING